MLSILIPNYNRNIKSLVEKLGEQAGEESIDFEIIIGDDLSDELFRKQYGELEKLKYVKVFMHKQRLGRSANRNFLGSSAKYKWLLFIDSNAELQEPLFIRNYLESAGKADVIIGGMAFSDIAPAKTDHLLRWKYGRTREMKTAKERNISPYRSFISFNFMISKELFSSIGFDERIKSYGHEDTLFGYRLKEAGISVLHIDNMLVHSSLDSARTFLNKTRKGVENLKYIRQLVENKKSFDRDVKLLRTYRLLAAFGLNYLLRLLFKACRRNMVGKLLSDKPRIFILQLYKLSYLCSL